MWLNSAQTTLSKFLFIKGNVSIAINHSRYVLDDIALGLRVKGIHEEIHWCRVEGMATSSRVEGMTLGGSTSRNLRKCRNVAKFSSNYSEQVFIHQGKCVNCH